MTYGIDPDPYDEPEPFIKEELMPRQRRHDIPEPFDHRIDRDEVITVDENPQMVSDSKLMQMMDSTDPDVQQKAREEYFRRLPPEDEQ